MIGKRTKMSKSMLKNEILSRMSALDTQNEDYSNNELLLDFEEIIKS